jgi:hypothetical protein
MPFLRYLYRNINPLNILLLLLIVSIVVFAVMPLFRAKVRYALPAVKTKVVQEANLAKESTPAASPADFMVVSENNLFHPERKIPPEKKEEKALPKPELVLYGTIVSEDLTVAYLEDKKSPKTSPGRGKRQTVARKGDIFGGFVLRDIEQDRIVLSRGEEVMVVRLTEAGKHRETPTTGAQGKPSAASAGPAGFQASAGPAVAPPSPVVARPSPTPVLPQPSAAASPNTPNVPGVSSRQQRVLEVQRLKAARPTGP